MFGMHSLLAGSVQALLYHALDLPWQLAGVPDEYRSFCQCPPIPFRSPVSTFHRLRTASIAYGPNSASVLSHTLVRQLGTHALPDDIRATSDSVVFRRQLKTHYFSQLLMSCNFMFY